MMLTDVLNAPLPIQPNKSYSNDNAEVATMRPDMSDEVIGTPDLDEAPVVYEKLLDGTVSVEDICRSGVLNIIKDRLNKQAESDKMSSRTAPPWVQYDVGMMDIFRKYNRAERTGNWALHLQTIHNMLPYLTASGHNLYTKSARVYLKEEHPDVHQCFEGGLLVIRRSHVGRSVIGSEYRVGSDEKHDDQRRANMRARDNVETAPVVSCCCQRQHVLE